MTTYIALLRGINVTGHNKIKMAKLKQLFLDEGFKNVTTYIQSGNVIFQSELSETAKIEQIIINAIKKLFGYSIKVLILTKSHLETIFTSNPFIHNSTFDISKLHVTILKDEPNNETILEIENLISSSEDEFKVIGKTVFIYCPNGYGKTKINNNLFEKKLKTSATSRNWRTITKLIELSSQ